MDKKHTREVFNQEYYSIDPRSFGQLSNLKKLIVSSSSRDVKLNARFFRPYCIAYLDQVMQQVCEEEFRCVYSWDPALNKYLQQSGFKYVALGVEAKGDFPQDDIIKLNRFTDQSQLDSSIKDIFENIVCRYVPNCSKELRKKIVESMAEITNNGFIHGMSRYGISCCGQYYPNKSYFEIAFYDSGYGLAKRVSDYRSGGNEKLTDCDCIEWAMKKGNSTLQVADAGLGLYLLREFVRLNRGAFQIIAGNGFYGDMEKKIDAKQTIMNSIDGTLVNIRINISDNILYKMKGE